MALENSGHLLKFQDSETNNLLLLHIMKLLISFKRVKFATMHMCTYPHVEIKIIIVKEVGSKCLRWIAKSHVWRSFQTWDVWDEVNGNLKLLIWPITFWSHYFLAAITHCQYWAMKLLPPALFFKMRRSSLCLCRCENIWIYHLMCKSKCGIHEPAFKFCVRLGEMRNWARPFSSLAKSYWSKSKLIN